MLVLPDETCMLSPQQVRKILQPPFLDVLLAVCQSDSIFSQMTITLHEEWVWILAILSSRSRENDGTDGG